MSVFQQPIFHHNADNQSVVSFQQNNGLQVSFNKEAYKNIMLENQIKNLSIQPNMPQLSTSQISHQERRRMHVQHVDTRNLSQNQCISFLDLHTFKTEECTQNPQNHNHKRCPFYHDFAKDRRRPLGTYQSEMCPHVLAGGQQKQGKMTEESINCPYGDKCDRAHNRVEEFYHPDKYKAKFCSSFLDPKRTPECEYQEFCSFAHSEEELSVELIERYEKDMDFYIFHFKTVWCPYKEDDHDRKACVYAHNWQDYRRKPSVFQYSSKMCPNWKTSNFITSYQEGCPNMYQC